MDYSESVSEASQEVSSRGREGMVPPYGLKVGYQHCFGNHLGVAYMMMLHVSFVAPACGDARSLAFSGVYHLEKATGRRTLLSKRATVCILLRIKSDHMELTELVASRLPASNAWKPHAKDIFVRSAVHASF